MDVQPVRTTRVSTQERAGAVGGAVVVVIAAVLLVTATSSRDVVSSGLLVSVGSLLVLTPWRRRVRAVGIAVSVLAVSALALAVVGIIAL